MPSESPNIKYVQYNSIVQYVIDFNYIKVRKPWGRKESDTTEWLNWTELKKAMNIMGMEKYIPVSETILILNLLIYLAVYLT